MAFDPARRALLQGSAVLGMGALLENVSAPSILGAPRKNVQRSWLAALPPTPARLYVMSDGQRLEQCDRNGSRFTTRQAQVTVSANDNGATRIDVESPNAPISRIVVRWEKSFPGQALFLGDHWERGYGDLQWRHMQPERVMPWYFAAHDTASGATFCAGVQTQPNALCFWTVDHDGVSLWLDLRNGGSPSMPGQRVITAATVLCGASHAGESPMATLTRFCRTMSPSPRLASHPICGNNNWYYAYGKNFDADAIRRDAAYLAELADGHANKPYCVIDAGWTPGSSAPGGPWTQGRPDLFPDMPGLARDMRRAGVRPGIWMRPTALTTIDDPKRLRAGPAPDEEKPLDLTLPQNLTLIHDDVARVASWGYDLIKHDFSTYDVFGRWGFEMGADITNRGWNFADKRLTNAEIILNLYRTMRNAAGETILLGCNTIGHLGAGFFEIQRTGDDTSGQRWERTRRMGVNTLAFRLPQHGTFFASDPDCAPHTSETPWEYDKQYLDLVARSGTALFVSADPRTVTAEQKGAFGRAVQLALSGGEPGGCEPLDWLRTTAPREWRLGNKRVTYHWEEGAGAWPMRV